MGKLQRRVADDLTLYVRQLAWLNATPKPVAGTKRAKAEDDHPRPTRAEAMAKRRVTPAMPSNPLPHIIGWLIELGLSEAAGSGIGPISWATITAWEASAEVPLTPWERRLLRQLSVEYVVGGRRYECETAPAPWHTAVTQREIDTEQQRLEMLLG